MVATLLSWVSFLLISSPFLFHPSSLDGFVAIIRFTEDELGSLVSIEEKKEIFRGLYGNIDALTIPSDTPCIVENTAQLRLEQLAQKPPEDDRRITKRVGPSLHPIHPSSRRGGWDEVITCRPSVSSSSSTKGGKKRIRPVQVNDEGGNKDEGAEPLRARGCFMDHSLTTNGAMEREEEEQGHHHILGDKRSTVMKQRRLGGEGGGGKTVATDLYRPVIHVHMKTNDAGPLVTRNSFPLTVPPEGVSMDEATTNGEKSTPSVIVRQIQSFDDAVESMGRSIISSDGHGLEEIIGTDSLRSSRKLILECRHLPSCHVQGMSADIYSKVTLSFGGKRLWRDFIAGQTSCCCGNLRMSAVGTTDSSIYVYDRVGIRRAPAIVVGAGAAHLECSQVKANVSEAKSVEEEEEEEGTEKPNFLMCISTDGIVQVWDMTSLKLHVRGSLEPLISSLRVQPKTKMDTTTSSATSSATISPLSTTTDNPVVKVVRSGITPDGSPVVIMGCSGAFGGSLQAFLLHHGLSAWVRVADGRFALSNFHQGLGDVLAGDGPVSQLQASVSYGVKVSTSALHIGGGDSDIIANQKEALQWCVTRAHLEDSLSCSSLLSSNDELKHWLSLYAHHLSNCSEPDIVRLRALVDYLQCNSVVDKDKDKNSDENRLCGGAETARVGKRWLHRGQDGRKLVREIVLPAMSANRQLQKLINEIDSEDKLFLSQQQSDNIADKA